MARNRAAAETETVTAETPEVENVETEAAAPVETAEAESAPAAETKPEVVIDLTAYEAAVTEAVEARDETTGALADAPLAAIVAEYRKLDGVKAKNAARKSADNGMKEAMKESNISLARAYMKITESLTSAPSSKSSDGTAAVREPVNPTEAFIERVAGLKLALNLVQSEVPEGVDEDWADKAKAKIEAGTTAAAAYNEAAKVEGGDLPETDAWVVSAIKLAAGKSAKVGGARRSTGGGSTFDGPRRDIAKHITEAFAAEESGKFLSIAEIRKFKSAEYGDDSPSAGAISARLFPKGGESKVDGVTPKIENDKKGAVKN